MTRPRKFKKRQRQAARPCRSKYTDGAHVRCRVCTARRTLARVLSSYIRVPSCRRCGARDYRVDGYRMRREVGAGAPRPCTCPQYHFPHFMGRGLCIHNPRVTEAYEAERRGVSEPAPAGPTVAELIANAYLPPRRREPEPCPF